MGEKGIPLQSDSMDALIQLADSVKAPVATDPVDMLAGWPLKTIQDAVRDTPELANKWMEAYLNWREIQERRTPGQGPATPPSKPPDPRSG